NVKSTINGYMFSNGPIMTMRKGEHVRWYLMTMGNRFNFHTPHWHGNLVSVRGQYMDVLPTIGPAQFVAADMIPDMPGTWMFHCHVDHHERWHVDDVPGARRRRLKIGAGKRAWCRPPPALDPGMRMAGAERASGIKRSHHRQSARRYFVARSIKM